MEKPKKYYLFFLHTTPDLSVDIWGYNHRLQENVIVKLANYLSENAIIVKEHPATFGRDFDFLKKLKATKNIYFISSKNLTENKDLILKSEGVITIAGSVAIEAVCLGVNAYVLGNSPYNKIEGVIELDINNLNLSRKPINKE